MNQKIVATLLIYLFSYFPIFSQSSQKTAKFSGDCSTVIVIIPTGTYSFKSSPIGYGEVLDIKSNSRTSKYFFTEENNTTWFTFVAKKSTILTFDIIPLDIHSDFDFLLFEYTDEDFCSDIKQKKTKPIRTNISRFDTTKLGITGLSVTATSPFVAPGIGDNYSQAITTVEGHRYYLVINNVYGSNSPFKLRFKHYTTTIISGTLKDEKTSKTVSNAKITWEQGTGEVLAETTSDNDGNFEFVAPILKTSKDKAYVLTATDDDFNFTEKIVFASQKDSIKHIEIALPKLVLGEKMGLHNIHFYGDQAVILPKSQKSLKRLYRFMKHNTQYTIRIEGHTNGCSSGKLFSQKLSTERAKTVKRYLVEKNIQANRISIIGYGCSKMLFPEDSSPEQQSLNRRVEFVIVDIKQKGEENK